jgi:hypothetical protein
MWPANLRVVVPVATSHRNTDLSPPADANFALSWALCRGQGGAGYSRQENEHSDAKDFVAVSIKHFDFGA